MKLWLRADLAATPATAPERFINRWNDQSGSGNHLISPASNSSTPQKILNALYGKPSISFGAVGLAQLIPAASTNQGLSMGGIEGEENTLNDVLTIFAVVKDNGSGDGSVIVERKTLDESVGYSVRLKNESNGNSVESKFDASVIKATQVQNSQPFLLPSGFNLIVQQVRADLPTSHSLGVNRTGSAIQHNIQTIPTTVARFFSLGARRRAQDQNPSSPSTMPDRGFNGEIAEMLVFDKALNAVEARRVEAYLIGRYSLNADSRVPLPELAMPNVTPESGMWQSGVTIEATHEESESVTLEYRYVWGDVMLAETPWSVYSESFPLVGVGPCTVQVRASKSGYKEAVKEFRLTIDPTVGSLPRQGMALWLAADKEIDLVYAGGDVPRTARWRDLSGNGNDAVPDVVNAGPDVINSSFIKYNTPGLAGSPAKALIFPNGNRRLIVKDAAELASATSIFVVTRSGLINDRIRVILQKLSSGVNGADGGWSISYHNITGRIGVSSLSTFDSPITVTGTQTNAAQLISLTANSMQVLGKTLDIQTGSFIPANNTGDDLYIGGSERFTFRATGTMGTDILSGINAADMPRLGAGMVINGSPVTGFLITEKISTSSVKLSRKVENASRTGNYGATSYMSGEIAEIIVYTGNLSASEVRDVQSYLMNKYEFAHKPALQSPLIQASPSGQSIGGVFTEGRTVSIIGEPGSTLYYRINDGEVQTANGNAVVTVGPGIDASSAAASIIAWSQKNGYAESAPSHAMILIDPDGALVPKADLKLWVRGDSSLTETSESAAVTRWLDLSGQGHHLTKPNVSSVGFPVKEEVEEFNGHPVVKFNSLGKTCLEGNYPGLDGENVSVFAIVRRPANFSTTVSVLAEKFTPLASAVDKGYSLQLINTESPKFNFRTRDTTIASTLTDTGRPCVLVGGTHADHAMNLNYQGNSVATKTFTTATKVLTGANPFYVGGRKAANNFDGEVAEIWVYDRAISQDEINRLSVYAHRRYGIQSNKQIPAPTANYEGGTFSVGLGVRLNCSISDVKIHYELGGEGQLDVPDPTENSPFFYPGDITGVISISGSLRVLKVVAKKPGLVDSDIKTWVYRIESGKSIVRRGLIAWFKSDRGVSVDPNLRVSRWSDQSGLGNDAVAPSAGASPYFVTDPQGATGLPVIRFNEAGLTAPLSLRIPHPLRYPGETSNFETMSVLAVTRKLGTNNSLLLKKGGYQLRLAGTATAPRGSLMVNGMTALTIPIRQNAFESITSTYDRVLRRISNGESMATANGTAAVTQDSNPLFIGSNVNTASSSNLQGEVAEIIIYNTGLSEAERQQMESYLRGNYGIYNPSLAIVSKPYFSPGGVTDGSVALDLPGRVAIVSQPGSVTYYTSDADLINAPSTSTWTRYTQPIYVGYTTTLAAFSRVEGLEPVNSAISLVTFELDELKYPGPVIDENDMTPPTVILEKPTNAVPITP